MAIVFTESAAKHGFTQQDAVTAMLEPLGYIESFEPSWDRSLPDPSLWIGPSTDGTLIEVMTYTLVPSRLVIFHVMKARQKFLDRI